MKGDTECKVEWSRTTAVPVHSYYTLPDTIASVMEG